MYYQSALSKTISYVEHNLCESFSLEELTEINGFSRWHFSRVFHLFTGYSISEYIRGRRLSEAAVELVETSHKIIDIALDYQFSSQDAFTRSFTSAYGISPGRFRKLGQRKILINPLDVSKIIWMQGGLEVKPEIIIIEDLKVMGLVYKGKNENQEIGGLWQEFFTRVQEITSSKNNMKSYGICEPLEENVEDVDLDNPNNFKYLAGVEVFDGKKIPKGMEVWDVPHKKYAVFTHKGPVEMLGDTYKAIYSQWLPESGYEVVFTYDFELYDKDFKPGDKKSKMYIYIPIK